MIRLMIPIVFLFPLLACSVLMTRSEEALLREKEKNIYILKKDIDINDKKLKKGGEVRIVIATGREWVKVYAYPVRFDSLKAERYLILYLFEDEFMNKKFAADLFDEKLSAVVEEKNSAEHEKRRQLKKK